MGESVSGKVDDSVGDCENPPFLCNSGVQSGLIAIPAGFGNGKQHAQSQNFSNRNRLRGLMAMRMHFVVSAVLAGLLVFLMNAMVQQDSGGANTGIPTVQTFDYQMMNLDYMQYDANGTPSYRLLADSITHFPAPEFNTLNKPRFVILEDQDIVWTISANSGRTEDELFSGEQRVDLEDSVVIHGLDSEGREVNIYTSNLRVFPESRSAITDNNVRITGENSNLTATGMTVDLRSSRIRLRTNVRGTYGIQEN
jgi:lipopolysaccharide export system protein LptC